MNSWDRTQIPKPLRRVSLVLDEPLFVDGTSEEALAEGTRRLTERLAPPKRAPSSDSPLRESGSWKLTLHKSPAGDSGRLTEIVSRNLTGLPAFRAVCTATPSPR